jgi:hypothetical protein
MKRIDYYQNFIAYEIDPKLSGYWKKRISGIQKKIGSIDTQSKDQQNLFRIYFSSEETDGKAGIEFNVRCLDQSANLFQFKNQDFSKYIDLDWTDEMSESDIIVCITSILKQWWHKKKKSFFLQGNQRMLLLEKEAKQCFIFKDDLKEKDLSKVLQIVDCVLQAAFHFIYNPIQLNTHYIKDLFEKLSLKSESVDLLHESQEEKFLSGFVFLENNEFGNFFLTWDENTISELDKFKIYYFLQVVFNHLKNKQQMKSDVDNILNDVFMTLPCPVLVLDEATNWFLSNLFFSKLNITHKQALDLSSKNQVTINEITYSIKRNYFFCKNKKLLVIYFINSNFFTSSTLPSSKEVAVITSSMAHELNNPIAGLKVAVEYLSSIQEVSTESKEVLLEMKRTIDRCQKLTQTFLGFSKPLSHLSISSHEEIEIQNIWEQTQYLIRSRMIENGLRPQFQYELLHYFGYKLQASSLVMIFYIILNEWITSITRRQLLEGYKNKSLQVNFYLREQTDCLMIEGPAGENLKNLMNSKFFLFLLLDLKLEIKMENNKILMQYRPNLLSF